MVLCLLFKRHVKEVCLHCKLFGVYINNQEVDYIDFRFMLILVLFLFFCFVVDFFRKVQRVLKYYQNSSPALFVFKNKKSFFEDFK